MVCTDWLMARRFSSPQFVMLSVVARHTTRLAAPVFTKNAASRACMAMSTKYTTQHEYIKVSGDKGTIGISDFAQNQLGDVVFIDLPDVGETIEKGESFGAVESVKTASDVYMPVSGTITDVNEELAENPALVNEAAMGDGWFVKVDLTDASELDGLMDEAEYENMCEELEH